MLLEAWSFTLPVVLRALRVKSVMVAVVGESPAFSVPAPPVSAASLLPAAAAWVMMISVGSMRIEPFAPEIAETSTAPVRLKPLSPETSTRPPAETPLAVMVPAMAVDCVLSSAMVPPCPALPASALIVAPFATVTADAAGAVTALPPAARANVVPSAMVPPPALPDAVILAPLATATLPVPVISILPPVVPGFLPCAETVPVTATPPPVALIATLPVCAPADVTAVLALMTPPAVTRLVMMPSAAAAVSWMVPPWAMMVPVLVTNAATGLPSAPTGAVVTWRVTSMDISPSP